MASELTDITCELIHETALAILIDDGGDKQIWLPKSQIEISRPNPRKPYLLEVTMPTRLAKEKGLI